MDSQGTNDRSLWYNLSATTFAPFEPGEQADRRHLDPQSGSVLPEAKSLGS
jgi:hypothetical protein